MENKNNESKIDSSSLCLKCCKELRFINYDKCVGCLKPYEIKSDEIEDFITMSMYRYELFGCLVGNRGNCIRSNFGRYKSYRTGKIINDKIRTDRKGEQYLYLSDGDRKEKYCVDTSINYFKDKENEEERIKKIMEENKDNFIERNSERFDIKENVVVSYNFVR